MMEILRVRLPSKFKILPKELAFSTFKNKEKWRVLDFKIKRQVLRSMIFWDIGWFAENITQRWSQGKKSGKRFKTPAFHRDLWQVVLDGNDVVIICPRGFAKTTAVSKILALWLLLFELEKSILIISSQGLGESIIGDIKRELEENKQIKVIFGELVPITSKALQQEKWRQKEIQLLNGCEIKTLTKGQAVRGQRPTMIIIDDPEENKDVKNPVIAAEFFNWVFTTLYNALDDGGSMVVLGTIISTNCFVNKLKQEAKERGFSVMEFPALKNFDWKIWKDTKDFDRASKNAISLWPERWTMKKLKAKLKKIKEAAFFQEFMHIPLILNATPVFDASINFNVLKPIEIKDEVMIFRKLIDVDEEGNVVKLHNAYVGIDVANGNVNGDYSVITVRDEQHRLLCQYRGHIAQHRLAGVLDTILSWFNDSIVVVENNIALAFINECKNYPWFSQFYRMKKLDKVTQTETEVIGWNTNGKTKTLMVGDFEKVIEVDELEVSEIEEEEIRHYYHDEHGGMNALAPYHDDTVISDCLTIQAIKHGLYAPIFAMM